MAAALSQNSDDGAKARIIHNPISEAFGGGCSTSELSIEHMLSKACLVAACSKGIVEQYAGVALSAQRIALLVRSPTEPMRRAISP